MSILDAYGRTFPAPVAAPSEQKAMSLEELAERLAVGQFGSASGLAVNVNTAVKVGAVLACTRVIADGCATPPLEIFSEDSDGRRVRAVREPMYRLLKKKPNPWMTSFRFRRTMTMHAVLTGDAVALRTKRDNRTLELIPVPPECVMIERRPNYEIRYHISDPYGDVIGTFQPKDVFHLRGMSWDGFEGMDVVQLARETLGLTLRIEEGQAKAHKNGLRLSGFLTTEATMSAESLEKIRVSLREYSQEQAGGVGILDMGFKYHPLSMTMAEGQTLEQRRFQIEEICRFMGVFPAMIGQADKTATYASAEAFFAAHQRYTLAPWHENWVQEIDAQLLDDTGPLEAQFDTSDFEKAGEKDRAEAGRSWVETGVYTRNELRRREGLDPLPGLDEPLTPLNMNKEGDDAGDA